VGGHFPKLERGNINGINLQKMEIDDCARFKLLLQKQRTPS